ncbi:MAG: hypothetical protein ACE14T_12150 [Syntrophales bacterium]
MRTTRETVLKLLAEGKTPKEAARIAGCSKTLVYDLARPKRSAAEKPPMVAQMVPQYCTKCGGMVIPDFVPAVEGQAQDEFRCVACGARYYGTQRRAA